MLAHVTSKNEYYYKGHELYKQLLHTACVQFDTLPPPLYTNVLLSVSSTTMYSQHVHTHVYTLTCTRKDFMYMYIFLILERLKPTDHIEKVFLCDRV